MKTFSGALCCRGHDDGTGHSIRSQANGVCVACRRMHDRGAVHGGISTAYPEAEWFERNLRMLRSLEPNRRRDYLHGVEIARGKPAAQALERELKKPVPLRHVGLSILKAVAAA